MSSKKKDEYRSRTPLNDRGHPVANGIPPRAESEQSFTTRTSSKRYGALDDENRGTPHPPGGGGPNRIKCIGIKTFIDKSMGLPVRPATFYIYGVYYFFLLFTGIIFTTVSGVSRFETKGDREIELVSARVLCFVVGLFFVAVFFYWCFFHIWEQRWKNQQGCCDFSVMVFFWWLLFFIWSGLFCSLLTEALDSSREISFRVYFNTTCPTPNNPKSQCFYFVVPSTLILLILFQLFYFFNFLFSFNCCKQRNG